MIRNQYIITNTQGKFPDGGNVLKLEEWSIWTHNELSISICNEGKAILTLIGFIFYPDKPENSIVQILKELNQYEFYTDSFFNFFNQMTGRFILMVVFNTKIYILNDAGAQRQVYYHFQEEKLFCTSSPQLFNSFFNSDWKVTDEKRVIVQSIRYKKLEQWFPGGEFIDNKLHRLLPNFYLDVMTRKEVRIPFQVKKWEDVDQLKNYIYRQINGSLKASSIYFEKNLIAVTAGSDSRLILSCLDQTVSPEYFIYRREFENEIDYKISNLMIKKIGKNLTVIQPPENSKSFINEFQKQFLFPRIISKLRNIEWLKNNYDHTNTVVIAGYAGELLRNSVNSINPFHKKFDAIVDFVDYLHYPPTEYLNNSITQWFHSTSEYIKNCENLSLLDLFHWEQHMAPYCGLYSFEQDFSGVEIFCPLSNRQLILNLIQNTSDDQRSLPDGLIYQIINERKPEWNNIPYNPKPFVKKLKDEIFKILPLIWVNRLINLK